MSDRPSSRRRARRRRSRATLRGSPTPARPGSRSALSPSQRTTAPPGATNGRQSSTATGGFASAFANATPYVSTGCSSARPQTTSTFGSSAANVSRKRHFRRSASSRVNSRVGISTARGRPGEPPPEPTSTTGPSKRPTSRAALSASSSRTRRAATASSNAVAPGADTTSSSQRSRTPSATSAGEDAREDDDEAVRLGSLARRLHLRIVF